MEHIGVRKLREQLGQTIDEAHFRDVHTVVEKNGEPRAVLVPYEWWRQHQPQEDQN